ncbi:hypothetical protein EDD36DRAFT_478628 [Exophiala viscosa]|uniref:Uncharacterized protein n=1 Tax=Exophiala viscosa TaxID=2486360 RepID=A0AAN6DLX1_9EURO|nr:hypothetical protein EDD36DRAFT_478628 [Exophiala viscosa]
MKLITSIAILVLALSASSEPIPQPSSSESHHSFSLSPEMLSSLQEMHHSHMATTLPSHTTGESEIAHVTPIVLHVHQLML